MEPISPDTVRVFLAEDFVYNTSMYEGTWDSEGKISLMGEDAYRTEREMPPLYETDSYRECQKGEAELRVHILFKIERLRDLASILQCIEQMIAEDFPRAPRGDTPCYRIHACQKILAGTGFVQYHFSNATIKTLETIKRIAYVLSQQPKKIYPETAVNAWNQSNPEASS